MTPEQYESRIAALGFDNGTDWAEYVGIDRATYYRHVNENRVPKALQLIVDLLEKVPSENPNYTRFYVWPNGHVYEADEYDQFEDVERDTSDDYRTVYTLNEDAAAQLA